MRPFGHRSGTLRGIAAFVSLALTAAIFLLLRVTSVPRPEAKGTEREVAVMLFPSPPDRTRAAPSPVAAPAAKAAPRITAGPRSRGAISAPRAELDSPRATRSEVLADTIAEKGVSDCLAPNAGGSLLSAPLLLLLAVQGKCK